MFKCGEHKKTTIEGEKKTKHARERCWPGRFFPPPAGYWKMRRYNILPNLLILTILSSVYFLKNFRNLILLPKQFFAIYFS
jgi:hypothetical protein